MLVLAGNNRIRTLGGVVRRNGNGGTTIENSAGIEEEDQDSYQGYTIVSGRFRTPDRQGEITQSCM